MDEKDNPSLYSGKLGIILFLSHYLHYNGESSRNDDLFNNYLENYLEEISEGIENHTYCNGISGILSGFELMNKNSLINVDISSFESGYKEYLLYKTSQNFHHVNYDFMHGGLGAPFYFTNNEEFIESALIGLESISIRDGNKLKWKSSLGQDRGIGYNIALSHGISSIIIYLSRIYNKGIMPEKTHDLMEGAVNYVLSQEVDYKKVGSCFPSQSLENGDPLYKSRMGWCYGDLGVAVALWQAGKAADNDAWKTKALDVFRYSALRRNPQDGMIRDAGLCHGSAGVAMMFRYMYEQTNDAIFLETSEYWLWVTLGLAQFPDGLAGYKKFTPDNMGNEYSLLEGISGIGLMLMLGIKEQLPDNWIRLFLLFK